MKKEVTTITRSCRAGTVALSVVSVLALGFSATALYLTKQPLYAITQLQKITTNALEEASAQQKALDAAIQAQRLQLQAVLNEHAHQEGNWPLLKARYLLQLAEIDARWGHDVDTLIALLSEADAILVAAHEPGSETVREAIEKTREAILATPKPDIAGLLSRLDALSDQVFYLSNSSIPKIMPTQEHTQENSTHSMVGFLKQLIIIRQHSESVQPLLSLADETALKTNLQLQLQMVQWAVLQQNQAVFNLTLEQAQKTLERGFHLRNAAYVALSEALKTLPKAWVTFEVPDLNTPLRTLNTLIAQSSQGNKHD